MWDAWFSSPPVAFAVLSVAVAVLYWLSGRLAATGKDAPGKRLPYACGEDLLPGEARLSYRRFFRLALMFVVVHMGTLVIATLAGAREMRWLASGYLVGIVICVDALVAEDHSE